MERAGPAVSRETEARLQLYLGELRRWQGAVNLVAPSTLDEAWTRHVLDCLQLVALEPEAGTWVDMGSGAGLPGLIVAAADPARHVILIESDSRKAAFLRSTAKLMDVAAEIREGRIEDVLSTAEPVPRVVTARALASLKRLIGYAEKPLSSGAIGLFPKGERHAAELTEAGECWRFKADVSPSLTDPHGRIVRVSGFAGRI